MKRLRQIGSWQGVGAVLCGMLAFLTGDPVQAASAERPNVIVIITDDLGYGDLACHGNPFARTPNLDRLHANSVRMTDFHVSPRCTASRASLMTGRYSVRTGAWDTDHFSRVRRDETVMPEMFKAGGYATGLFGKWHLGDSWPYRPQDRGFDSTITFRGWGVTSAPDHWMNDYHGDTYLENGVEKRVDGYCTDVWFDQAMAFIREKREHPFFAYIATNTPHFPKIVERRYAGHYLEHGPERDREMGAAFYGMIENIDDNIGRLMTLLDELSLRQNTIVVFLSDNGTDFPNWHDAGLRGKKGSEYEGGHRAPCFISWPARRIGGGRDRDDLALHLDILPTLADLCGLRQAPSQPWDGRSLAPALMNTAAPWRDRIAFVDDQGFLAVPEKWRKNSVMTNRWRLVNGAELYAIREDPSQKRDVAAQFPETVAELRQAYDSWWSDVTQRAEDYPPIFIGSDEEAEVLLHAVEWHERTTTNKLADRMALARNTTAVGHWRVEIVQDGRYEFELRRWPRELNAPIDGDVPAHRLEPNLFFPGHENYFLAGKGIPARRARLTVGDATRRVDIEPGAAAVTITLPLSRGRARIDTALLSHDRGDTIASAYYVYVRRRAD